MKTDKNDKVIIRCRKFKNKDDKLIVSDKKFLEEIETKYRYFDKR